MTAAPPELSRLAGRLRARIAERRYPEARTAVEEYCTALRKTVAALPPHDPALGPLQQEWLQLLTETRRRVLAFQAQARARLVRTLQSPPRYADTPPRRTREWSA